VVVVVVVEQQQCLLRARLPAAEQLLPLLQRLLQTHLQWL